MVCCSLWAACDRLLAVQAGPVLGASSLEDSRRMFIKRPLLDTLTIRSRPPGHVPRDVWFDDVVVAANRVGCNRARTTRIARPSGACIERTRPG
jgi:hypothetical protein